MMCKRDRSELGAPDPWPSEKPLFITAARLLDAAVDGAYPSVIGLVYAGFFASVIMLVRAVFIAHVRGSGVRLGSDQFPELYGSVVRVSRQFGHDGLRRMRISCRTVAC